MIYRCELVSLKLRNLLQNLVSYKIPSPADVAAPLEIMEIFFPISRELLL